MKKYAGYIIAALAVIIGIVGYVLLPDTVVMQITASGSSGTTMGKLPAMAVLTAITAILGITGNKNCGKHNQPVSLVAGILLVVMILTIVLNLTVFA